MLDELRELSERLVRRYHWSDAETTWFVLTGTTPTRAPLRVGTERSVGLRQHERSVGTGQMISYRVGITLNVEAWVPASTVVKAYRAAQRRVLVGENRPLSKRSLTLFRFVSERMNEQGEFPPWSELLDEWNRTYPQWQSLDRRGFAKRFRRVEQKLVFPTVR